MAKTNCDTCSHYVYDEEYDEYICMINLDEDDYARLMSGMDYACPYYDAYDEYKVVRRQNGI